MTYFLFVVIINILSLLSDTFREMASSSEQSGIAQKTWELSNNIETISTMDEIYRYDRKEQHDILTAKPWEKE